MKFLSYAAALCLVAAPAFANAHLTKSSPANGAKIKSPHRVVLTFSEALEPAFSGALLLDRDGRNLSGEPVKVSGRVITLSPAPLDPGLYTVSWHAVGHEGKRLEGRIHFTIRP
jgi:methionine-rich copper-binding protein CopC